MSFGDYLTFVADVLRAHRDLADQLLPKHGQSSALWTWDGAKVVPAQILQWGKDQQQLLSLPVFGVDETCAEVYAGWLSKRTGRPYRLPREDEWEKAGRGTDGRLYPWGDHFDASFCCMRESQPGQPAPLPSGHFAVDVSPFGVRDLSGGIAEWVSPLRPNDFKRGLRRSVSRGGAWCDWRNDCLLSARRHYLRGERSARVGFRLARDAPAGTAYTVTRMEGLVIP